MTPHRRLTSLVLSLVVSWVAAGAVAQTFPVAFYKNHFADDDLVVVPPAQPTANVNDLAHYRLRVGNCAAFSDLMGTACGAPSPAPLTNGTVVDHPSDLPGTPPTPPFEADLDCSRPFEAEVAGVARGTMTCDEATNTITVTGITLAPGEILDIGYWAQFTVSGNVCNQATLTYDEMVDPATPLRSHAILFPGPTEPFCVNVGGGGGQPGFTKEPLGVPCIQTNPIQDQWDRCADWGADVTWRVTADNTTGQPLTFDLEDPGPNPDGCFTLSCPPIVRLNGIDQGWPPATAADATCDEATGAWTITDFSVPVNAVVTVDFDTVLASDWALCSNAAFISGLPPPAPMQPRSSGDPDPNCASATGQPIATQLRHCMPAVFTPLDGMKAIEDPAGNPIDIVDDGESVCFRIRLENTSPDTTVTGNLTDDFDPRIVGLVGAPPDFGTGTCSLAGSTLTCTGIVLAPGEVREARYCGTFDCSFGSGELCNGAFISVTDPPPPAPTPVQTHPPGVPTPGPTCVPVSGPDFATALKSAFIEHVAGPDDCVDPRERIRYSVSLRNTGTVPATGVVLTDPTPPGTSYDPSSCMIGGVPCGAGSPAGGLDIGTIAVDQRVIVDWAVDVDTVSPPQQICNTGATVAYEQCGGTIFALPEACVDTCALPEPNPGITKTVSPTGTVATGETLTYTLRTCNTGGASMTGAVVTDSLDPCLEYVGGSLSITPPPPAAPRALTDDPADGDGGGVVTGPPSVVTFTFEEVILGSLGPGECVVATFDVVAAEACAGTSVVNGADGTSNEVASFTSNDVSTPVQGAGSLLDLAKSVDVTDPVAPGAVLVYTVQACNNGSVLTDRVVVTDLVPPCGKYDDESMAIDGRRVTDSAADADGGSFDGTSVSFDLDQALGGGLLGCVDLSFAVMVEDCPAGAISNTATATSTQVPSVQSNTVRNDVIVVPASPSILKSVIPAGTAQVGDTLAYTLETCNAPGAGGVSGVVVTDALPPCLTHVAGSIRLDGSARTEAADGDGATVVGGTLEIDLAAFGASPLPGGSCVTIEFDVTVNGCAGDEVANLATGTSDQVASFDSNTVRTRVAALTVRKTVTDVDGDPLEPGDVLEYDVETCNLSPAPVDFDVRDSLVPATAPSACRPIFEPGSLALDLPGGRVPLTDVAGDDAGEYDGTATPPRVTARVTALGTGECATLTFRVQADPACLARECLTNVATATWGGGLSADSNAVDSCIAAAVDLYRNVGRASLTRTGGCENGPRLAAFDCASIPATCQVDVPALRWRLVGDGAPSGEALVFYEVHGDGCCAASDTRTLRISKDRSVAPVADVMAELAAGCP